ncbi:MAG: class I SAM-dependent methyltransferase [Desulfobacter sp.]|nr:MAG: class I SAM-dependent methyltransferase [Desulfobacter sp.]
MAIAPLVEKKSGSVIFGDPAISGSTPGRKDRYKFIGPAYDFLSTLYSGRQIHNTKIAMNSHLRPGQRVLFAGAGHGRDAVDAAMRGAKVTVVDLSATMLRHLEKNIGNREFDHPIRLVHSNILDVSEPGKYDQVVANFFLNVFSETAMQEVVTHMAELVKPGGGFVVGDFCYPCGSPFTRSLQNLYWYLAVLLFTVFAKNAFHSIYNYPSHLEKIGLSIDRTRYFNMFGLPLFWSVRAVKPEQGGA